MKRENPETSIDAYHSLDPVKISAIHKGILTALAIIKNGNYEDISRKMKEQPQRIWRRLSELDKAGLICRNGERKPLKSGRDGFVWTLTANGNQIVESSQELLPGKPVQEYSKEIHSNYKPNTLF